MKIIKTKQGEYLNSNQEKRFLKKLPEGNKYESFLISGFPEKNKALKKLKSCLREHPSWTVVYLSIDRLPLSAYYVLSLTIVKQISQDFIGNRFEIVNEDPDTLPL